MRVYRPEVLKLKFAATESNTQTGTFSGYASTYGGSPDSYNEIIQPGAFAKSLARHAKEDTRPALLWQHDQTSPIGRWEKFEDTAQGLLADGWSGLVRDEQDQSEELAALAEEIRRMTRTLIPN